MAILVRVFSFFILSAVSLLSPALALAGESTMLDVTVDHARVLKLSHPAETVIVGNPAIVDVTVHDSQTLVLTGRTYGITNLVVLGPDGQPVLDESVVVNSFEENTVRVYRQAARVTYACSPSCEPTVTIGDADQAFATAAGQFTARQGMATGALQ